MTDPRSDLSARLRLALNDELLVQAEDAGTQALQYTKAELAMDASAVVVSADEWTRRKWNAQRDVLVAALVPVCRAREYAAIESIGRLSSLLARTANALKGPPPAPMVDHGWLDLPEVAQRLTEERERIRQWVDERRRMALAAKVTAKGPAADCWQAVANAYAAVLATLTPARQETNVNGSDT